MKTLKKILKEAIAGGAKVIRLKAGGVPEYEAGGHLMKVHGLDPINSEYIHMLYREMFENGGQLGPSSPPKKGKLLVNGESGRGEYLLLAQPKEQALMIIPPYGPEALNLFEKLWRSLIGADEERPISGQQMLREKNPFLSDRGPQKASDIGMTVPPPIPTPGASLFETVAPIAMGNPLDSKKLDVELSGNSTDFRLEKFSVDNRAGGIPTPGNAKADLGLAPPFPAGNLDFGNQAQNSGFEGLNFNEGKKTNANLKPKSDGVTVSPSRVEGLGFDAFANLKKSSDSGELEAFGDLGSLKLEHPDESAPDFNKIVSEEAELPSLEKQVHHAPVAVADEKIKYGPNIYLTGSAVGTHRAINDLLDEVIKRKASDLHLTVGQPAALRVDGDIIRLKNWVINEQNMASFFDPIVPQNNLEEFIERNDTDFAYEYEGKERFRVNLYRDINGVGAVMRRIPLDIPSIEKLDLPPAVIKFCDYNKGLVLVTGPTGSGKTTTLAAMIDYINRHRAKHIITIEDPIEFVHSQKQCLITQRQVSSHTKSFSSALRAALREDPDIVMIGEMRDLETVSIALETSETGHLVFGTLHTNTAIATIDRIVDQFPTDQQEQIRIMLSESLIGVVSQTLLKRKSGGRVPAVEVLVTSQAVKSNIREKKTHMLKGILQTKKSEGNTLLSESLIELVKKGVVDVNDAYFKAIDKAEFMQLLQQAGIPLKNVA